MYRQGVYKALDQKRAKDEKLHPSFRAPAVAASAKSTPTAAAPSKPASSATAREDRYEIGNSTSYDSSGWS